MAVKTLSWTAAEFNEFRRLVDGTGAPGFDNHKRVVARLDLNTFVAKHGKEKCDLMYADLCRLERPTNKRLATRRTRTGNPPEIIGEK